MTAHLFRRVVVALALCCAVSYGAHARGASAPPPNIIGLGNAGDWLPNGPLFGFDTPLGWDFDGGDGSGGDGGFEFSGSGDGLPGTGSPHGPTACHCPTGDCQRFLPDRCRQGRNDYCMNRCVCEVKLPEPMPPSGAVVIGSCRLTASFKSSVSGCAATGDPCTVQYGGGGR